MKPRPGLLAPQSAWLLAAAAASAAPLAPQLPQDLVLAVALALAWRAAIAYRLIGPPPRWLLSSLALATAATIALRYGTLFGRDPGVALLVALQAMKLLEMRTRRDAYAVVLLSLFLIECRFLFDQSMASAALALIGVALACLALLRLQQPQLAAGVALRQSALMLAQAAPFTFVLFLLFPRIPGPLWGLPLDAHAGLSGLSERMAPGSISSLSLSEAIAFRVQFAGPRPAHSALYWRGPVLTRFDGEAWTAAASLAQRAMPYAVAGAAIDYSVTLEAHGKPWLFALELPALVPADAYLSADYQLLARSAVRERRRYEMRSHPVIVAGRDEAPARLGAALALPPGGNPRARALAARWRDEAGGDSAAVVARALSYYREQDFRYTLKPPLLGRQAMDDFLFESRRGFCEHYAASFVFVMRAAGIPARVVTGYQGGEENPVDDTLIVRQSDAHAWAEVWIEDRGWQRVDPTAAIAPSRVEFNMESALPEGEPLPLVTRFLWLRQLRYRWDALGNAWNQRVVGYDPGRQRELMARLGMRSPDWKGMTWALALICLPLLAALAAWALANRPRLDRAERAWRRLSARLEGRGLARRPWEGPRDYAARVAAAMPSSAPEVRAIADLYASLRYGRAPRPGALAELESRSLAFKP